MRCYVVGRQSKDEVQVRNDEMVSTASTAMKPRVFPKIDLAFTELKNNPG